MIGALVSVAGAEGAEAVERDMNRSHLQRFSVAILARLPISRKSGKQLFAGLG